MTSKTSKTTTDGRKLRAENRRIKIYETLLSFYREGIFAPSIAEIEKRSGVSRRTLHHLFKNAEGLAAAVAGYLDPTYEKLYQLS
jgi:AcrR family transcriptional regulator